jgi:hypothetical protein
MKTLAVYIEDPAIDYRKSRNLHKKLTINMKDCTIKIKPSQLKPQGLTWMAGAVDIFWG